MKCVYPAIFDIAEDGISVYFPDVPGAITCGDTIPEAMLMAEDALAIILAETITEGRPLPTPTEIGKLCAGANSHVHLIACDTARYERNFAKRAVKKTLTIPKWLNDKAIELGINFSETLKEALIEKIEESRQ